MGSLLRTASGPLRRHGSLLAILACVFIASRIFFWFLGIRFDAEPLQFYWQYIDPALLQHDFWRSIFYLEQQPPAFNFFLGAILHLAPNHSDFAFQAVYLCLGLALSLSLFPLMERMGVDRPIALLITLSFVLSPSSVLYENLLFYEYPLSVLFCVAGLFLHRYAAGGRMLDGVAFFCCLAAISGIRSIYHLAWFAGTVAFIVFALPLWRRQTLIAMTAPCIVLVLLYAKHIIVFRNFAPGGGIYSAINLGVMTSSDLPPDALDQLVGSGKISPILKTNLFRFVKDLDTDVAESSLADIVAFAPKTGIPVLDDCEKSTEAFNWNCIWAAHMARLYTRDSLVVLRTYPRAYFRSVASNVLRYCLPDTDEWPFDGRSDDSNQRILSRPLAVYNVATTGTLPPVWDRPWLSYIALPGLFLFGLFRVIPGFLDPRRLKRQMHDPTWITLVFVIFNVAYLTALVLLFAFADQNRYRSEMSSFFAVLLGLLFTHCVTAIRQAP